MTTANVSKGPQPAPPIGSGLVDVYLEYTKELSSPAIFRKWAAIFAIGAAAERRVWTRIVGGRILYPNIFVFLVSPPGIGKSTAIGPMAALLRKSAAVQLSPNDLTKQGLLDSLGEAGKGAVLNGRPFDYHFLAICISELSNFMSKYDLDMAGLLTNLYDCEDMNDEKKRTHNKGKAIAFPGVSFLVGTATQNLGNTIPQDMWGSGFMARIIMVFSAEEVIPIDMFADTEHVDARLETRLITGLRNIGSLVGPMTWTAEARILNNHMRQHQKDGAPVHNRLTHYNTRRWMHLSKLTMIAALAEETLNVTEAHHHTAMEWLLEAEHMMPEIFKDMATHEDGQIYEEMRSVMFQVHMRGGHGPITHAALVRWLSSRVASHSVQRIIEIAVSAQLFIRCAGTWGDDSEYIPQMPNGTLNLGVM